MYTKHRPPPKAPERPPEAPAAGAAPKRPPARPMLSIHICVYTYIYIWLYIQIVCVCFKCILVTYIYIYNICIYIYIYIYICSCQKPKPQPSSLDCRIEGRAESNARPMLKYNEYTNRTLANSRCSSVRMCTCLHVLHLCTRLLNITGLCLDVGIGTHIQRVTSSAPASWLPSLMST